MKAGEAAVAHPSWLWTDGMLAISQAADKSAVTFRIEPDSQEIKEHPNAIPDLLDAATIGCILSRVRKLWKSRYATTFYDEHEGWTVKKLYSHKNGEIAVLPYFKFEEDALLYALRVGFEQN